MSILVEDCMLLLVNIKFISKPIAVLNGSHSMRIIHCDIDLLTAETMGVFLLQV